MNHEGAGKREAHEESARGSRLHLPLQLFWGKVQMAQRGRNE